MGKGAIMLLIEAIKDGSRDGLKITTSDFLRVKTVAILQKHMRLTMETKAYMYVLECTDGTLHWL